MGETKTKSKPQSSRKGKRAWRKNIDIQEVESGLQASRDSEVILGKSNENEEDFIIDETPQIKPNVEVKKLKMNEILTNKSKVPALTHPKESKKPKTIQGVKRTDVLKLVKLTGGRYKSESTMLNRIEKDGLMNVSNDDLWKEDEKEATPVDGFSSTAEVTRASVIPKTLSHAPIHVVDNELTSKTVHAGKSYNPSLESWKDLINQEYDLEYKRELARQQIAEHREKIKVLMETLKDDNLSESDNEEEEEEREQEKEEEQADEEDAYRLSINKPTQVKIKTKTKRNKEAKHKKRVELEQQLKDLKTQLKDLSNLDELLKQQGEEEQQEQPATKKQRKSQKLFKYNPIQAPLEVKLSNELTNNLKNVKPEGNLFYDQMLKLQSTGKIEARVPVAKKKKYTPKITEKWTYKDFK